MRSLVSYENINVDFAKYHDNFSTFIKNTAPSPKTPKNSKPKIFTHATSLKVYFYIF